MLNFVVVVLSSFLLVARAHTDYCAADICHQPGTHTACIQKLLSWNSACPEPNKVLSTISAADKTTIVDYHNELRRKVAKGLETRGAEGSQPGGANMRKIVWNEEIAAIAQTLAQTCKFAHDICRNLPGMYVGQNIAMTGSSVPYTQVDWKNAISMWYNEVDFMKQAIVSNFGSQSTTKPVGHYTQVVWAETTQVGCGVSAYKESGFYRLLYVCNYGPGGNYMGWPLYQIGAAASACPAGTNAEDGLCA